MAISPLPPNGLPAPPWDAFHDVLAALARDLAAAGDETGGARLAVVTERWWAEQCAWADAVAERMKVHHDINNALVGVSGSAQLLLIGPAGADRKTRERLEVILRESGRITQAVRSLGELRAQLKREPPAGGDFAMGGGGHVGPRG